MAEFDSLLDGAWQALVSCDLDDKVALTEELAHRWESRSLSLSGSVKRNPPTRPGRPERPILLPPADVPKRPLNSRKGRLALIHAIAHIELNAIDLALDIIVRFARENMPRSFFDGWVKVAREEAKHFNLLRGRLEKMNATYGDLPAHDGLWEAAGETGHDLVSRLALFPWYWKHADLTLRPPW